MTRVERQTMYLATFHELIEQAAEKVPPNMLKTWLGGAKTMCLALAQNDDEVSEITYTFMLELFRQAAEDL